VKLAAWFVRTLGLPPLSPQIWILAVGRLLSQVGTGFTLFYAPIFFVNQVHLSATAVGLGLGSASLSGIIGRVLSGSMTDSARWGRRPTLLLSAFISACAAFVFASANNFPLFVVGNLLMGLGMGLYWPATEAVVADLAPPDLRNEAYALTRFADGFGLGAGVILGGLLISTTGAYRTLFWIDGISFLVFWVVVYCAIAETRNPNQMVHPTWQGWQVAFNDRRLLVYVGVNVLFTTYIVQMESTLPLYLSNFVQFPDTEKGFSPSMISGLFAGHLALGTLLQLPVARWLKRLRHAQALIISACLWSLGFSLIWMTGTSQTFTLGWAILALAIMAGAVVSYTPSASALVAEMAPESLRGIYLSINSLCWAVGYFIGPPLGGLALDQPRPIADTFWLGLASSVMVVIIILRWLDRLLKPAIEHSSAT
jgi:MFS family permease